MPLYRGTPIKVPDCILENKYLNNSRWPLNSDQNVHKVADEWLYENFGIRGRSQTIFCSTCIEQARLYCQDHGSLLKIEIPNNNEYKLIYSPNVHDFTEIETKIDCINNDQQILDWLEGKDYQCVKSIDELPEDFKGEVMLFCTQYEVKNVG